MTKFKIGFKISGDSEANGKSYGYLISKYKIQPIGISRKEFNKVLKTGSYVEVAGDFYDLFKLYHVAEPSVMISTFDVPKDLSSSLVREIEYLSPGVSLIDNLDDMPMSLKSYLSKTQNKIMMTDKKFAVVKGSAHDVYFVMSNIRDDVSDDSLKSAHRYDAICEEFNLPSMIPHLKIR